MHFGTPGSADAGFTGSGVGSSGCSAVDLCATGTNGGCDPKTACTSYPNGTSSCGACPAGYMGSGATLCKPAPGRCGPPPDNGGCDDRTTCREVSGSVVCGPCPYGFSGTGATGCRDTDGCSANAAQAGSTTPCFPGVKCTDIPAAASSNVSDPLGRGFTCGVRFPPLRRPALPFPAHCCAAWRCAAAPSLHARSQPHNATAAVRRVWPA